MQSAAETDGDSDHERTERYRAPAKIGQPAPQQRLQGSDQQADPGGESGDPLKTWVWPRQGRQHRVEDPGTCQISEPGGRSPSDQSSAILKIQAAEAGGVGSDQGSCELVRLSDQRTLPTHSCTLRMLSHPARNGADTPFHAGRDARNGQGNQHRATGQNGRSDGAVEHLSPASAAWRGHHRRGRWSAPVHGLGWSDAD